VTSKYIMGEIFCHFGEENIIKPRLPVINMRRIYLISA